MAGQEQGLEAGERSGGRPRCADAHLGMILDLLSGYALCQPVLTPPSRAFQTSTGQALDVLLRDIAPPAPA